MSSKFHPNEKGNTFTSLFPQSLPAKQSPHVCWQLKIGLSAWGNAQAQSHYQTKLSSDVEPVYFWGVKRRGISSLCNWRLERRVGAQRLGDYGKMSLSWTFSSLISHFAIFSTTLHNFLWACFQNVARPLYTKVQVCLAVCLFFQSLTIQDAVMLVVIPLQESCTIQSNLKRFN